MATRKAADVDRALTAKGMERHAAHHTMYRKRIEGVTQLVTRISHGAREINDGLAKRMANQCALTPKEFADLVDCTLTAEAWDALVSERCAGGRNPFLGFR